MASSPGSTSSAPPSYRQDIHLRECPELLVAERRFDNQRPKDFGLLADEYQRFCSRGGVPPGAAAWNFPGFPQPNILIDCRYEDIQGPYLIQVGLYADNIPRLMREGLGLSPNCIVPGRTIILTDYEMPFVNDFGTQHPW